MLKENMKRPLIVISTSAASNVTSQITPFKEISIIIKEFKKQHPNLANKIVWCANLAAYVSHRPLDITDLNLDAVFISPHN